jgi:polygalacturonase
MLGVGVMKGVVTLGGRDYPIDQPDLGGQYTQSPFIFTVAYTAGNSAFAAANATAQFRDISIRRVSVDNGRPGQGGSFIAVDAYDGSDPKLSFPASFQKNIVSWRIYLGRRAL